MIIKIDNIDKSSLIDWHSFELTNVISKEIDTLKFDLRVHPGKTYAPELFQEITVFENGTKIYGGYIIQINRKVKGMLQYWEILCKDYHYVLDRKLVYRNYTEDNAGNIVKDIIDDFTTGFTTNNVATGPVIKGISFNYLQVSKAIQEVASRANYDWYVDENKDIHFFSKEARDAPFKLDDKKGNFIWNSLEINRDISQIKNSIFVRGGVEALGPKTFQKIADGNQRIFNLGYTFTNLNIRVNGEIQTFGLDGLDDPATKDCLYNPDNQIIIFRADNKPANGIVVEWEGNATMPVFIHIPDEVSVAKYGEFQFQIIDKSITSNIEAKQRAQGELDKYKSQTSEVIFRTKKDGLKVGQRIRINSSILGIDEWFIINRLITRIIKPTTNEKEYIVSLIGSEKIGIIHVLERLLGTEPTKNVEVSDYEILYKYRLISEICRITESIMASIVSTIEEAISILEDIRNDPWGAGVAPTWVLGPYAPPTGLDDPKRPIWCDRDAWVY